MILAPNMKQITRDNVSQLVHAAQASPRQRMNLNLHEDLTDSIQRLAIAMEPSTYIRAQMHTHTWELLFHLGGRFVVLNFDEEGMVTERTVLGEDCLAVEIPAYRWHAVLSLDPGGVIFEVKHGPYTPITEAGFATWAPADGTPGVADIMAWYATAQVGDRYGA
jgi:cupin fold WbuC family metalloprotein